MLSWRVSNLHTRVIKLESDVQWHILGTLGQVLNSCDEVLGKIQSDEAIQSLEAFDLVDAVLLQITAHKAKITQQRSHVRSMKDVSLFKVVHGEVRTFDATQRNIEDPQ